HDRKPPAPSAPLRLRLPHPHVAARRAAARAGGVRRHGGGLRLRREALPDASADAVVSFQVLEHVDDVETYLSECNRVLRPGGRLVLTTHGIWVYHPMAGICEDYWRWTGAGLRKTVEAYGFARTRLHSACAGWRSTMQQL